MPQTRTTLFALVMLPTLAWAGSIQERNQASALAFFNGWGKEPTEELFDRYIAENMLQHGAAMRDGKRSYQAFIAAMARPRTSGASPGAVPPSNGEAPRGAPPSVTRVTLAENDLVVVLAGQSVDMLRFNAEGKAIEKWGYWQPQSAAIDPPAGAAGKEERNRRNGAAFLTGLKSVADVRPQSSRYLAAGFRRLANQGSRDRDAYVMELTEAISNGARWSIRHSVAEKDMAVFIAANSQRDDAPAPGRATSPPGGGRAGGGPAMDPADLDARGSMSSPGCGDDPGFPSPERGKQGRAAAIAMRFDAAGKITELWQVEQPYDAWWACAGRWHANSLF